MSADDILKYFFLFFPENRLIFHANSPFKTFFMKCQRLFTGEKKSEKYYQLVEKIRKICSVCQRLKTTVCLNENMYVNCACWDQTAHAPLLRKHYKKKKKEKKEQCLPILDCANPAVASGLNNLTNDKMRTIFLFSPITRI